MNLYEEDKFIIKDENNNQKTFYKLIIFESTITNKSYIIYTDNGKNIYSSILLNNDLNNILLEKITNEIDLEEVNKALIQAKINVDNN